MRIRRGFWRSGGLNFKGAVNALKARLEHSGCTPPWDLFAGCVLAQAVAGNTENSRAVWGRVSIAQVSPSCAAAFGGLIRTPEPLAVSRAHPRGVRIGSQGFLIAFHGSGPQKERFPPCFFALRNF